MPTIASKTRNVDEDAMPLLVNEVHTHTVHTTMILHNKLMKDHKLLIKGMMQVKCRSDPVILLLKY